MPDITSFSNFAVPRRTLSPTEQAVYDEAAVTWAMLAERQQQVLYVQLLDGRLAERANQVFLQTASSIKAQAAGIKDPEIQSLAQRFRQKLITEHANHQLAYYRTAAMRFTETLGAPMRPPTPPPAPRYGFLQRVAAALEG